MIEFWRKLLLGLAFAGYTSCSSGGGTPPPQPPTPPPDPSPVCEPGATCGCWHRPPGEDWQQLPPCPTPPPVEPPPVTPPPAQGCVLAGEPGAVMPSYVSPPLADGRRLGDKVNDAIGALTGCRAPERCIILARPQTYQAAVTEELRAKGYCAGQHAPDTDEIAVQHPATKAWEGFHIYAGDGWHNPSANGTAVWYFPVTGPVTHPYSGSARPAYAPPGGTVPPPTPPPIEPPPVAGCSAPLPPKVWTAETLPDGWGPDEIGKPRWEIGCALHGRVVDCTPKVAPRACAYCDAIGMGYYEDTGVQRCGCPVRNECKPPEQVPPQNFKCEERVACEQYLSGGTRLDARGGATCEFAGSNPWQFKPSDGNCRLCSVGDPRVCGEWF